MAELTSSATFDVADAAVAVAEVQLDVLPSAPIESGYGRLVHPVYGAYDYEVKPDQWVNIDADPIIAPIWASTRTLTSAANVLWQGNLRDVVVEERWLSLGGLAMPMGQLRMMVLMYTHPIDPLVGYVNWFPNYISPLGFKVILPNLTAGGQGITFDDVVNAKLADGSPNGWMTAPVTLTIKIVEQL